MINRLKLAGLKIVRSVRRLIRFLSYDIWRMNNSDKSARKIGLYTILKSFVLAFRNIDTSRLNTRAAALTYSSLLSIIPMLAVLFAIARGFGFQNIVQSQLFGFFAGQEETLQKMMSFIDGSIEYAQGGVFLGIGVILLLYTVINLLSNIELNFNRVWRINKGRSYYRLFTDYLALIILLPIFLVCNAGFAVLLAAAFDGDIIGLVMSPMMKLIPYAVLILVFTFLFAYIPNTKVKFSSALIGGIFAGVCIQIFQMLYISGQLWISKYNAIYGSFAALPLLLLWMQMSWFIVLIGVELSYAYQNVNKFDFDYETNTTSRRYRDFVTLVMMTLMVKRFEKGEKPYTADELSELYKIPTRMTSDILLYLMNVSLIVETPSEEELVPAYVPAIDINRIDVSFVIEKISRHGTEDFSIDREDTFSKEWETILGIGKAVKESKGNKLLKDL